MSDFVAKMLPIQSCIWVVVQVLYAYFCLKCTQCMRSIYAICTHASCKALLQTLLPRNELMMLHTASAPRTVRHVDACSLQRNILSHCKNTKPRAEYERPIEHGLPYIYHPCFKCYNTTFVVTNKVFVCALSHRPRLPLLLVLAFPGFLASIVFLYIPIIIWCIFSVLSIRTRDQTDKVCPHNITPRTNTIATEYIYDAIYIYDLITYWSRHVVLYVLQTMLFLPESIIIMKQD